MIKDKSQYLEAETIANLHRYLVEVDGRVHALEAAITLTVGVLGGMAPQFQAIIHDSLRTLSDNIMKGDAADSIAEVKRHNMSSAILSIIEASTEQVLTFTVIKGGLDGPQDVN